MAKQNREQMAAHIQQQQAELVKQSESIAEQIKQLEKEQRKLLEERRKQAESVQDSEEEPQLAKQNRETLSQALVLGAAGISLLTASVNFANTAAAEETQPIAYEEAPRPDPAELPDQVKDRIVAHQMVDTSSMSSEIDPSELVAQEAVLEYAISRHQGVSEEALQERNARLKQDIVGLLEKHPESPAKYRVLQLLRSY